MIGFRAGERVAVDDPGLAALRAIFEKHEGKPPPPNNEGVVDSVGEDGTVYINFDDGGQAPYQPHEVRHI